MKVDPDYLRELYGSLTDEALLEIKRDDLVEAAQKCYDAELSKRNLSSFPPASEVDLAEESPDWLDEAATVYSCGVKQGEPPTAETGNALDVLQGAQIPCFLEKSEIPSQEQGNSEPMHLWSVVVPGYLNLMAQSTLQRDLHNPAVEAEWRAHLETLSDDELLTMTPQAVFCGLFDRITRVNRVYAQELANRRLG